MINRRNFFIFFYLMQGQLKTTKSTIETITPELNIKRKGRRRRKKEKEKKKKKEDDNK